MIAETGAGQHGVATATIAARYGLECVVYMGSEDVAPGAERLPHETARRERGAGRERIEDAQDALNEALRDWVTNVDNTSTSSAPSPVRTRIR